MGDVHALPLRRAGYQGLLLLTPEVGTPYDVRVLARCELRSMLVFSDVVHCLRLELAPVEQGLSQTRLVVNRVHLSQLGLRKGKRC